MKRCKSCDPTIHEGGCNWLDGMAPDDRCPHCHEPVEWFKPTSLGDQLDRLSMIEPGDAPPTRAPDWMGDAVRAVIAAEYARIETVCEQMLTADPPAGGVRVDRVDGLLVSVRLDSRVPWGTLHEHLHISGRSDGTLEGDLMQTWAAVLRNDRWRL
jgi:hypothetical protein